MKFSPLFLLLAACADLPPTPTAGFFDDHCRFHNHARNIPDCAKVTLTADPERLSLAEKFGAPYACVCVAESLRPPEIMCKR